MTGSIKQNEYAELLKDIKQRIHSAQYEALKKVNKELIQLYWDIGKMIIERQEGQTWGKSIVARLSNDLQAEFPRIKGFSTQNLWYMRQFYTAYQNNEKLQPMVGEIGWAHNIIIISKCKDDLQPEYVGKMQFYLAVLDDKVKMPDENSSIGMILCKTKDKTIVEYALKESNKPIGVAKYKIVKTLPDEMKNLLPTPEQIEYLLEEG